MGVHECCNAFRVTSVSNHYEEQAIPDPKDGEILIKVKASAVNRTDIINRENNLGYLDNSILGVEVAEIVEKVDAGSEIRIGTSVMGLVNGGG
ncbi:alcohol dehydrogenase catalytic domain-containing protein [Sporosarcina newyorkensis]|uniref:alcohol dehydrogenase catalytic domain-containing protein n=1 Tax=Sporosarcina newyorkensis TaxID=759851 RepID=UPI0009DB11D3|nr:alcohol dehydrogenase catalytic domain-containing protein [Sporosarcina newyorkensis]